MRCGKKRKIESPTNEMRRNSSYQQRYSRQLGLEGFGEQAQAQLLDAKVLVIGAGGLGCPILQYLVGMGIGSIGIVDHDSIDVSNLHRQLLFTTSDIGRKKVIVAREQLRKINPEVKIATYGVQLTADNAFEIIDGYDFVVDATDQIATRYLINDSCTILNKVLIHGAIHKYEGQVAVFNAIQSDGRRSTNYRDLFPNPPSMEEIPTCNEAGVLGHHVGLVALHMCNELVKCITKSPQLVLNQVMFLDLNSGASRKITIKPNDSKQTITSLVALDDYCSSDQNSAEISHHELLRLPIESFLLVDVRDPEEAAEFNIGGVNIPLQEIDEHIETFSHHDMIVLYCRSGARSNKAVKRLSEKYNMANTMSLKGGILAIGLDEPMQDSIVHLGG